MENPLLTSFILYWPILAALLLLFYNFFINKESIGGDAPLRFGWGGFNIPIPIKKIILLRTVICLLAFYLFSIPLSYNYSEYFPKSFDIDAYFDDQGIESALNIFLDDEINDLNIPNDWKDHKRNYFIKLNDIILNVLKYKRFFDITGQCLTSKGVLTISVTKIKGFQHYYINESHGSLKHCVEIRNEKIRKINSEFNLLDTKDKYIKLNLYDIFIRGGKVIKPLYKQYIVTGPAEEDKNYNHDIVSLTKIKIFPSLDISRSIYLYQDNIRNIHIPIGYAVNRPK